MQHYAGSRAFGGDMVEDEDIQGLSPGHDQQGPSGNNQNLPTVNGSDIVLTIRSLSDLEAYHERERTAKSIIIDASYPHSTEAQQQWVKAIIQSLANLEDTEDGPKLLKQWDTMIKDRKVNLEIIAWDFLHRVMYYHAIEGRLEPSNHDTIKARKWNSFIDHMQYLIGALTVKKALCRHLAYDKWTCAFIDAPQMHTERVEANRRVNESKKVKSDAGKAAIQIVLNTGENAGSNMEEAQTVMNLTPTVATRGGATETRASVATTFRSDTSSSRSSTPQTVRRPKSNSTASKKAKRRSNKGKSVEIKREGTPEAAEHLTSSVGQIRFPSIQDQLAMRLASNAPHQANHAAVYQGSQEDHAFYMAGRNNAYDHDQPLNGSQYAYPGAFNQFHGYNHNNTYHS